MVSKWNNSKRILIHNSHIMSKIIKKCFFISNMKVIFQMIMHFDINRVNIIVIVIIRNICKNCLKRKRRVIN